MRTIAYILGGKPSNTADCLDHALRHPVQRIILTLRSVDEVTDQYEVCWLKGSFVWFFDDQTVACAVDFGGRFLHESSDRQQRSVENANRRLVHEIETIRAALPGVALEGADQRFEFAKRA